MRKVLLCLAILMGASLLVSCSSLSLLPTGDETTPQGKSQPSGEARSASPSPLPTPTEPPVIPVAQPWTEGEFQEGVQVYWHSTGSDEYVEKQATAVLDYVVQLGANSVGITFPVYTDGWYPTTVYTGEETPSIHQLSLVLEAAHERKLRVMLRPILDEANIASAGDDAWRGNIHPQDVAGWFGQYTQTLMPYFTLAQQEDVAEFVVGTELFSLESYTEEWAKLTQSATSVYSGMLSYGVNWSGFGEAAAPFSDIGLDFYLGTDLDDSATVDQLTQAMTAWLLQQSQDVLARLTIHEVGIAAESGAFRHSWYWGRQTVDPAYFDVQSRWFTAAYNAAATSGAQGIYYWMIDSNQQFSADAINSQPAGGFVGRPGADAIQQSFSTS